MYCIDDNCFSEVVVAKPYGTHWNQNKNMPECMIGGNLCDECYYSKRYAAAQKFEELVLDVLYKHNVKKRPVIQVFEENKDVEGVQSVYELTLTTTKDDPYELRQYFKKICDSKMFDVKAFKACFELCENGNPHIHAMLWSGKKVLNSNHIKAKIKFPYRFELKFVRRQENYYKYILKNKMCPNIIEYCNRKGIQQIWHTENMQHPEGEDPNAGAEANMLADVNAEDLIQL